MRSRHADQPPRRTAHLDRLHVPGIRIDHEFLLGDLRVGVHRPGPRLRHYNMITKGGATVGGAMRAVHMDGTPNPLAPAMWTTYLHTDAISGVYAASLEAGAAPIAEPMAVGPLGQMAVITAPTGAGVGMWQPGEFSGFDTPLTPGTPVWFELMTVNYP